MQKTFIGVLVVSAAILFLAFGFFNLYAHFALDYSLENLRQALETTREGDSTELGNRVFRSSIEGMAVEELVRQDADFEKAVLLENAARAVREAVDDFGSVRAGVYLTEVLKEKVPERGWGLRIADEVYHFFKSFSKALQGLWNYILRRTRIIPETPVLEETAALILAEAEKMERDWKLEEAERYYREFMDRFGDRPERGFVKISLAHVLTKMRRLKEAVEILKSVRKEFPATREETIVATLLERIVAIQKRLTRLPELENWIKGEPDRLYTEEGGLELALNYLATYQLDRAISVLQKVSEAKDPRIRAKALFYLGWTHKWQGDLDKGKVLFQMLKKEPRLDEKLAVAATVNLAEIHMEKKEYDEALEQFEELSKKAAKETWAALSELEQGGLYLLGVGDTEAARRSLQRLEKLLPQAAESLEEMRKRFEEIIEKGVRDEGFTALQQGRVEMALKIFENYLKKFPRDGMAHGGIASAYLLKGMLKEALKEAQTAHDLQANEYTATLLGYVLEKMGKIKEAGKYYNIAWQIKPSYLPARFNLAWSYVMTRRFQEADRLLAELEGERGGLLPLTRAKVLNNRGCALWGLGKRVEAVGRFKEALKVLPEFTEAKNNLNLAAAGEKPVPAVI